MTLRVEGIPYVVVSCDFNQRDRAKYDELCEEVKDKLKETLSDWLEITVGGDTSVERTVVEEVCQLGYKAEIIKKYNERFGSWNETIILRITIPQDCHSEKVIINVCWKDLDVITISANQKLRIDEGYLSLIRIINEKMVRENSNLKTSCRFDFYYLCKESLKITEKKVVLGYLNSIKDELQKAGYTLLDEGEEYR